MLANMGNLSPRIQKIELCLRLKRRLPLVSCELQAGGQAGTGPCAEAVGDVSFEDALTPCSPEESAALEKDIFWGYVVNG